MDYEFIPKKYRNGQKMEYASFPDLTQNMGVVEGFWSGFSVLPPPSGNEASTIRVPGNEALARQEG